MMGSTKLGFVVALVVLPGIAMAIGNDTSGCGDIEKAGRLRVSGRGSVSASPNVGKVRSSMVNPFVRSFQSRLTFQLSLSLGPSDRGKASLSLSLSLCTLFLCLSLASILLPICNCSSVATRTYHHCFSHFELLEMLLSYLTSSRRVIMTSC